ncbi:cytochrome C nitrite reductase [Halomicroarcula sp. F13]|uniref:Cytochrome C nitrite reductase n=1 Tax=Haloarcula rubra TaxID=2487747 RepID=A0AAW4PPX7_9EURY|nr:ethylbenzene dehydrogenase-related protein [Halomicroarcula rubra]MBX0323663.1 cytochrome C nitrite reductase [Halomicroarcula rubra]
MSVAGPLSRLRRSELVDGEAAVRSTLVAVVVAAGVLLAQGAVAAAVTSGAQPTAQVATAPTSPSAATWDDAPVRTVSLQKQQMAVPYGGGSTDELDVQVATNESHVALRLSWVDPTSDDGIRSPRNYSDAVAVMARAGDQPPITMGATGEPVNIWYWRSSWQFGNKSSEWSGDMYAYPHPDAETKPGRAAGNPLSRAAYENYAQNYYAEGYGSLSHAPTQPVQARGERTDDGWAVTFTRKRQTEGQFDASFDGSETVYLAFAVWNGSADEVNGKKSITLQYSTLDVESGELRPPESGGSGSSGSGGSGASSAGDSGGSAGSSGGAGDSGFGEFGGMLGTAVSAIVASWLVAYWRLAR